MLPLMVKSLLLHLLAVAAGWGIVTALRTSSPAQASPAGRHSSSAPTKAARTRPATDIAAGQKLLQRLAAKLPRTAEEEDPFGLPQKQPPRSKLSLAESYTFALGAASIDPARANSSFADLNATDQDLCYDILLSVLNLESHGGRDLTHAFLHGRLGAMEIYQQFAAELPGPASSDLLRRTLYDSLVRIDPMRAAPLLDSLSKEHAIGVKYWAARQHGRDFTPDALASLMATIPAPADPATSIPRQSVWLRQTPEFYENYGSDYLHWVEKLPAGVDRDWAAVALLLRLRDGDPASYNRIRAVITNPRMLHGFPPH